MINKLLFPTIFFFLAFFLSSPLNAQIYVSPTGDDNNPGTIEQPFRTLAKAVLLSGPDTLIFMRGGVYSESATIRLNKSGQADKYIKVFAYPGEKPILDFSDRKSVV